jgi:hypothetical protein
MGSEVYCVSEYLVIYKNPPEARAGEKWNATELEYLRTRVEELEACPGTPCRARETIEKLLVDEGCHCEGAGCDGCFPGLIEAAISSCPDPAPWRELLEAARTVAERGWVGVTKRGQAVLDDLVASVAAVDALAGEEVEGVA